MPKPKGQQRKSTGCVAGSPLSPTWCPCKKMQSLQNRIIQTCPDLVSLPLPLCPPCVSLPASPSPPVPCEPFHLNTFLSCEYMEPFQCSAMGDWTSQGQESLPQDNSTHTNYLLAHTCQSCWLKQGLSRWPALIRATLLLMLHAKPGSSSIQGSSDTGVE